MGLTVHLEKREENSAHCVYTFGSREEIVGRVVLHKDTGDIELADLSSTSEGASEQFYLAHVVPRLHTYLDQDAYPTSDQLDI